MTDPSIEQRLSSLEREVARLKVRTRTMLPKSQWVSAIKGTAKDDPIYEEIWRLGKQIRDAEEPAENG